MFFSRVRVLAAAGLGGLADLSSCPQGVLMPSELRLLLEEASAWLGPARSPCPMPQGGRAEVHLAPFLRARKGPALGSAGGRDRGAPARGSRSNTDPSRGHLPFLIAGGVGEGSAPPPSLGYLGTHVPGQAERESGADICSAGVGHGVGSGAEQGTGGSQRVAPFALNFLNLGSVSSRRRRSIPRA